MAIAAAGDAIRIAGGTYAGEPGTIVIDRDLTFEGGWASDFLFQDIENNPTIIDQRNLRRVFSASGAEFRLDGITIRRGSASGSGGGLWINGTAEATSGTVTRCAFLNNSSFALFGGGGAIANEGGSLTVTDCVLEGNDASQAGGAIWNSGTLRVGRTLIRANNAGQQAAAIHDSTVNAGRLEVFNCVIANNSTTSGGIGGAVGGLLDISNPEARFFNCTIDGNASSASGASLIHLDRSGGVGVGTPVTHSFSNCIFSFNTCVGTNDLDSISYVEQADSLQFSHNLFHGNGRTDDSTPLLPVTKDDTNPIGSDGNFEAEPEYANRILRDYHLQSDSAAIDAGTTLGQILVDFDGTERSFGEGYDIGAFEHVPVIPRNAVEDWSMYE
jgi:hypothetical protein